MTYIENIFVCIAALLLVAAFCMERKYLRFFLFAFAGMGACLASAYVNTFFASIYSATPFNATAEIAPVVEEVIKLLPLLFHLLVCNGYSFKDNSGNTELKYTYADDALGMYPDSILNLDPDKSYMYGTVSINGTPEISETLTAVTKDTPSGASLTYQWYRGDTPVSGANDRTYTPSEAEDVGQIIKVAVGADGYEGTLTAQTSGTVVKADAAAPTNLKILSITSDSIMVEVVSGCEYACKPADAGAPSADEWKGTGEFTGLTPNTKYRIYCRVKETPTHNASPVVYGEVTTAPDDSHVLSSAHATLNGPVKNQPLPDVSVDTPYISASVQ